MPWIQGAFALGGTALGGLMGGGSEHIGPGDAVPKWMRDDLQDLYMDVFNLQTPEYYQGDLIADRTQGYEDVLAQMYGFGAPGGMGYDIGNALYGAGMYGLGGMQGFGDYLSYMQDRGPNEFVYDQGTFDTIYGNLMPGMDAIQDAATADIYRQLEEATIPGIHLDSASSGNAYGTKSYNEGAIATRGALDRAADINAQYDLNALNAANAGGYGAGMANLNTANAFDNSMLQGYGNMAQLGGNLLGQSYDTMLGNMDLGLTAGQIDQDYAQSLIDAEMAKWNYNQQAPWLAQEAMMGMLPSYGNATFQGGESAFAGALEGLQTGLGLYGLGNDMGWWGSGGGGGYGTLPPWWPKSDEFNIGWEYMKS